MTFNRKKKPRDSYKTKTKNYFTDKYSNKSNTNRKGPETLVAVQFRKGAQAHLSEHQKSDTHLPLDFCCNKYKLHDVSLYEK